MDEAARPSTLRQLQKLYNGWRQWTHAVAGSQPVCYLCGELSKVMLCDACEADLVAAPNYPLNLKLAGLDVIYAAYSYRYPLNQIIYQAKFKQDVAALNVIRTALSAKVSTYLFGNWWLLPVPLSRRRYITRGYNQADVLAQSLAAEMGAPVVPPGWVTKQHRQAQSTLASAARRNNVRNSFSCRHRFDGLAVLIVDDVITTGATVTALAKSLRSAGAQAVGAVSLAVSIKR